MEAKFDISLKLANRTISLSKKIKKLVKSGATQDEIDAAETAAWKELEELMNNELSA